MSEIKKEENKEKEPNGFERNKNNYPLLAAIVGMFVCSALWILMTAK